MTARDEICDAGDYSHSPDFGDYSAPDEPDERDTDRKTMTRVGTTVAAIILPFRPYPLSLSLSLYFLVLVLGGCVIVLQCHSRFLIYFFFDDL